ncbi:MAG: MerR family transcriptional regulator [Clostridiales bacterium]|nr:MerR family transcriptional regulator [Clostridiales bacterium]
MKKYSTSEVAKIIGVQPNTVRMYEEWGLLPKALVYYPILTFAYNIINHM